MSVRQVQRLMNRLREFGAVGLTHQARGKPSNNRYPSDYRDTVLKLIRDHYYDFSPTLAREKLLSYITFQYLTRPYEVG
ncbi:hypothetical protein [Vibrio campbellii]|uniref:hypothetical protein n=1 Tax=Vibrio campbellii TaxID=680 RepID=UPI001E583BEA|nr:hypothetical protein [Vibrio campbellii]